MNPLLTSCLLGVFVTPFLGGSVNVALPDIGRSLGLGPVALNAVTTTFLVAAVVALVPLGSLADRIGRKRVFVTGIAIVGLAALASACALSGSWLIASRVVQGLGGAAVFATGSARLAAGFPPGERGRVMGLAAATVYLGLAVSPVVGGILTQAGGWRLAVVAVLPLCALAGWLERLSPSDPPARTTQAPFDAVGCALYIPAVLGLVAAALLVPSAHALWPALAGLALFAVLAWWELRHPAPVLDLRLWRGNRVFAFSNLSALISYGATFAVGFLFSLYLQYNCGLPAATAGWVLMAQPLIMAAVSPVAGRLSDRIDARFLATAGMGLTAVGLGLMLLLPDRGSLALALAVQAVLGSGFALFSSPNINATFGAVGPRSLGAAAAMLSTMRLAGQMLSMAVVLAVFRATLGPDPVSAAHHDGLAGAVRLCAAGFCALCVLGAGLSLARGPRQAPLNAAR